LENKRDEIEKSLLNVNFENYSKKMLNIVKEQTDCRDIVFHVRWLPDYDQYMDWEDFVLFFVMRAYRNVRENKKKVAVDTVVDREKDEVQNHKDNVPSEK
jgi:hypothetical protein